MVVREYGVVGAEWVNDLSYLNYSEIQTSLGEHDYFVIVTAIIHNVSVCKNTKYILNSRRLLVQSQH